MYYSLVQQLTNKTIFYRLDVINDGFIVTLKYISKIVRVHYNNYSNIIIYIDNDIADDLINVSSYNFNDLNEVLRMIDDLLYNKRLWLKKLYLTKYINKFTEEDMSYILDYLDT